MLPLNDLVPLLIILSLLILTGATGNLFVIIVYWKAKNMDKLTSTTFILTLAVLDFITCLVVIPMTMYFEYADFEVGDNFLCKLYVFSTPFVVSFSSFVMVAIALDRYLCICHPFRHIMNPLRARLMIVVAALMAVASSIIWPIAYSVWRKNDGNATVSTKSQINILSSEELSGGVKNGSLVDTYNITDSNITAGVPNTASHVVYTGKCDPDFLIISKELRIGYRKFHFILYFVALVVITVTYVLIYSYVVKRRRRRAIQRSTASRTACTTYEESNVQESGKHGNDENKNEEKVILRNDSGEIQESIKERLLIANIKTAVTLFVVTLVFAVTYLPAALIGDKIIPYNTIAFYTYFINNVANPIIYGFMNQKFRSDLKNILCKRRTRSTF